MCLYFVCEMRVCVLCGVSRRVSCVCGVCRVAWLAVWRRVPVRVRPARVGVAARRLRLASAARAACGRGQDSGNEL